ncbi:hypothetical protein [Spirosoma pollinicola]|nr:hypothetical protein [Spirosoma pollinicola]
MNNSIEKIYEWLLLHMGSEANYYTILNCHRAATAEGVPYLRIMGRLHEFKVVNLLIYSGQVPDLSAFGKVDELNNEQTQQLSFASQQQVIEYLTTGVMTNMASQTGVDSFRVLILAPTGDAGEITFPPEHTT